MSCKKDPKRNWPPLMWAIAVNRGDFGRVGHGAKSSFIRFKMEHPYTCKVDVNEVFRLVEELRICADMLKRGSV